ncbi:MAG: PaaI family thioesterase [Thermodesulfobacteriota bacterium]|nr:PaaI family thioesterase [Thermodesulfobacteriota bacterium]
MKKINQEYIERANELANNSPYFSLISMRISDVGIGYSTLEIDLDKRHLQPLGYIHGGVCAPIIDAAAWWAVFYDIEEQDSGLLSIDLKLNYLEPVTSGKLIAKGRRIRVGKSIGYAEAEVTNELERIVAHGTSTLMLLPGKGLNTDPPLPSKFVE